MIFQKQRITKISNNHIFVILLLLLIQFSNKTKNPNYDDIKGIQVSYKWQVLNDGQLVDIKDSLNIFFYKDLIVYQIGHPFEKRSVVVDTSGDISSDNLIKEGVRFSYFIYRKDSLYGLHYDSLSAIRFQRYLIDSFLKTKLSLNEEMFDLSKD